MKVLFITPILEYPATGGPQLRIDSSIKALSKVCNLDIFYCATCPSILNDQTNEFYSKYANLYRVIYKYSNNFFYKLIYKVYYRFFSENHNKHINKILNHIKKHSIDLVWFGFGNISFPLIEKIRKKLPGIKIVCDTDSVWSRFIMRELPFATGKRRRQIEIQGKKKKKEEKMLVELCDVTTAVSEVDVSYYKNIATYPDRIYKFSNVIDLDLYKIKPALPENFIKPCIFLAGSFGPNSAMNMAASWILDEVLPLLHKKFPNLHFYIVGRNSREEFGRFEGAHITVTGKLNSILPYLFHADVALVPLKFESGTRFKILEAGVCNVPLVSTTLGAEGIPVVDGEHILIADDSQKFALAVEKIISNQDLKKKLTKNCFNLVKNKYGINNLIFEANEILKYLKND